MWGAAAQAHEIMAPKAPPPPRSPNSRTKKLRWEYDFVAGLHLAPADQRRRQRLQRGVDLCVWVGCLQRGGMGGTLVFVRGGGGTTSPTTLIPPP